MNTQKINEIASEYAAEFGGDWLTWLRAITEVLALAWQDAWRREYERLRHGLFVPGAVDRCLPAVAAVEDRLLEELPCRSAA
jgi:hypothetical protein